MKLRLGSQVLLENREQNPLTPLLQFEDERNEFVFDVLDEQGNILRYIEIQLQQNVRAIKKIKEHSENSKSIIFEDTDGQELKVEISMNRPVLG